MGGGQPGERLVDAVGPQALVGTVGLGTGPAATGRGALRLVVRRACGHLRGAGVGACLGHGPARSGGPDGAFTAGIGRSPPAATGLVGVRSLVGLRLGCAPPPGGRGRVVGRDGPVVVGSGDLPSAAGRLRSVRRDGLIGLVVRSGSSSAGGGPQCRFHRLATGRRRCIEQALGGHRRAVPRALRGSAVERLWSDAGVDGPGRGRPTPIGAAGVPTSWRSGAGPLSVVRSAGQETVGRYGTGPCPPRHLAGSGRRPVGLRTQTAVLRGARSWSGLRLHAAADRRPVPGAAGPPGSQEAPTASRHAEWSVLRAPGVVPEGLHDRVAGSGRAGGPGRPVAGRWRRPRRVQQTVPYQELVRRFDPRWPWPDRGASDPVLIAAHATSSDRHGSRAGTGRPGPPICGAYGAQSPGRAAGCPSRPSHGRWSRCGRAQPTAGRRTARS